MGAIVLATGFDLAEGRSLESEPGTWKRANPFLPGNGRAVEQQRTDRGKNPDSPPIGSRRGSGSFPGPAWKFQAVGRLSPRFFWRSSLKFARMITGPDPREPGLGLCMRTCPDGGRSLIEAIRNCRGTRAVAFIRLEDPADIHWVADENQVPAGIPASQGEVQVDFFDLLIVAELSGRVKRDPGNWPGG